MFERVADLPLRIDGYELGVRERDTSSGFTRTTTTVVLRGDGATGRGEDVTYERADHESLWTLDVDLAGEYTLAGFSAHLDRLDLWPDPPSEERYRHYRRWGFESAALDLALRQAGRSLGAVVGREYDPVRFVVSTRLAETDGQPTADRVETWLDIDPGMEFKLDPTPAWGEDLVGTLAATDAVRVLDLKGHYDGEVGTEPDPDLYRRIVEGFPTAFVEDPALTDATRPVLAGHESRITWDVPVTGVESIETLPIEPEWLNMKPSRCGTVASVFETIDYCEREGIDLYGGGQFELGVGRGHLHALASLWYPDAPNDVAPTGYNAPEPRAGLPTSPLAPPTDSSGFGW